MLTPTGAPVPPRESQSHWAVLGGLRFFLAAVVVSCHVQAWLPQSNDILLQLQRFGANHAVWAFFIISGYSISHSLHQRPQGYMQRRIKRIYPAYFACLVVALLPFFLFANVKVANDMGGVPAPNIWQGLGNLILLQTLLVGLLPTYRATWSLVTEEMLYLCAPLLRRASCGLVWALLVLSLVVRFTLISLDIGGMGNTGNGLLTLASLAWLWLLGWQLKAFPISFWTAAATVVIPTLVVSVSKERNPFCILLTVCCPLLLIYAGKIPVSPRATKALSYLGDLSYPLYLVHMPLFALVFNGMHIASSGIYLPLAFFGALAVHHGVEKPLRAYWKKNAVAPATLPAAG